MTKKILAVLYMFMIFNVCPGYAADSGDGDVIKIGMISPMTGAAALFGQFEHDGATLAVEEINAAGGILGKQLQLIQGDDNSSPEGGVNGIRHLLDFENCIMIAGCSHSTIAIAEKEVTRDRVFHFVTAAQSAAITDDGHKWLVDANSMVQDYASGLDRHFLERFHPKRIALFIENTDFGQDNITLLEEILKDYPETEIVSTTWHNYTDADLTGALTQLKSTNPDLIFVINAAPGQIPQIYRQMHELGMDDIIKVHSAGQIGNAIIKASNGLMEGIYTADLWHPDLDNEMSKEFRTKFEKRFGYTPEKVSALAYMSISISAQAMTEAGSELNYDKIVEIIKSRPWKSMLAGDMVFDTNGRNHSRPILLQVVNDQLTIVQ